MSTEISKTPRTVYASVANGQLGCLPLSSAMFDSSLPTGTETKNSSLIFLGSFALVVVAVVAVVVITAAVVEAVVTAVAVTVLFLSFFFPFVFLSIFRSIC